MTVPQQPVVVRRPGRTDYAQTLQRMQDFTASRDNTTADEIWLLEHPPVFTLGTNADDAHVLAAGNIPVLHVDRGGQVTYHGPGQVVAYVLLDLKRLRLGIRELVCRLENAIISTLAIYDVTATGLDGAPGVYVDGQKIASVGLRIKKNCSYHGIAINVNPDLEPFDRINPCGYRDLTVTSMEKLGGTVEPDEFADTLLEQLTKQLHLIVAAA